MSMLFAFMAGGEGVRGKRFQNVLSGGGSIFSTCVVCGGWGMRSGSVPLLPYKK